MIKKNDSANSHLRYEMEDGTTIGQFYNSRDGKHHLAKYVPYAVNPHKYLCGNTGNFYPSRRDDDSKRCQDCVKALAGYE